MGVLIEHDRLPDEAYEEVLRRTAHRGRGLPGAAEDLLTANVCR
jgi:hypothetical protein